MRNVSNQVRDRLYSQIKNQLYDQINIQIDWHLFDRLWDKQQSQACNRVCQNVKEDFYIRFGKKWVNNGTERNRPF